MVSQSTGGIYLSPLGNTQDSYKFFSLKIGRKLSRRQFTSLPMPSDVIHRVKEYTAQEKSIIHLSSSTVIKIRFLTILRVLTKAMMTTTLFQAPLAKKLLVSSVILLTVFRSQE